MPGAVLQTENVGRSAVHVPGDVLFCFSFSVDACFVLSFRLSKMFSAAALLTISATTNVAKWWHLWDGRDLRSSHQREVEGNS